MGWVYHPTQSVWKACRSNTRQSMIHLHHITVQQLFNISKSWRNCCDWQVKLIITGRPTQQEVSNNKYVRLRGWTYIHICRSYVHMPHDFTNGASPAWRLRRRISTVMFTCGWAWPARWPIRPIWGFRGSKVHKNGTFPALNADEPPCKIWRR